jgi:DNA-binding transcriptional MerR regulator
MKRSITMQRKLYQTRALLANKYGVVPKTISVWVRRGVLPRPVRIGRAKYYDVAEVESRLVEFGMR